MSEIETENKDLRKLLTDLKVIPSPPVQEKMREETMDRLEKILLTTSKLGEPTHPCVLIIDSKYAIAYSHVFNPALKMNDNVDMYSLYDSSTYQTVVHEISKLYGVTFFEIVDGEFPFYPSSSSIYRGQIFSELSLSSCREPTWNTGVVGDRRMALFPSYVCNHATSSRKSDDSISGIFDTDGSFLGISIPKECLNNFPDMPLDKVVDQHLNIKIISADVIWVIGGIFTPASSPQYVPIPSHQGSAASSPQYVPT